MRKNSVNRKIVRSIGVGILAAMTTCTSVYAAADMDVMPGESDPTEGIDVEEQEPEKTGKNAAVSEALGNASTEIENTQNNLQSEENKEALGNVEEAVQEDLKDSNDAVEALEGEVGNLDGAIDDANEAVNNYNEAITDEIVEGGEKTGTEILADDVKDALDTAEDAITSTEGNKESAEEAAEKAEELQGQEYASKEEADAAKEQAQKEADAAQDAVDAAQSAFDTAQDEVNAAKESCDKLKELADAAERTRTEAQNKVAEAQKVLDELLKANGIGEGYKGDAGQALKKAQDALEKANARAVDAAREYADAEKAYNDALTKKENIENLNNSLTEWKEAKDELKAIAEAEDKAVAKENEATSAETERDEKEGVYKAAQAEVDRVNALNDMRSDISKFKEEHKGGLSDILNPADQKDEKALAEKMIRYKLSCESGVSDIHVDEWDLGGILKNHYVKITYSVNGEPRTEYFDYRRTKDAVMTIYHKNQPEKDAFGGLKFDGKDTEWLTEEKIASEQTQYDENIDILERARDDAKALYDQAYDTAVNTRSEAGRLREEANNVKKGEEAAQNKFETANNMVSDSLTTIKNSGETKLEALEVNDILDSFNKADEQRLSEILQEVSDGLTEAEGLFGEKKEYWNTNSSRLEQNKNNMEKIVTPAVKAAFDKVEEALENLKSLSVTTGDIDSQACKNLVDRYNKAVEDYNNAVTAMNSVQMNLNAAIAAAQRASAAAGGTFNYTTPTPPTGGADGGETGGGTDGGTTPGGTDDTTPGTATGDGTGDGAGDGGTTDETEAAVIPVVTDTTAPAAPAAVTALDADGAADVAVVRTVAGNGAGADLLQADAGGEVDADGEETDTVQLEDDEVPLASVDLDQAEEEGAEQTIEDEELPLAITDLETEQSRMSWWWLLIIAVLGAAGTEMYRRHRKNMEEESGAE